jgi:hypothetical protein
MQWLHERRRPAKDRQILRLRFKSSLEHRGLSIRDAFQTCVEVISGSSSPSYNILCLDKIGNVDCSIASSPSQRTGNFWERSNMPDNQQVQEYSSRDGVESMYDKHVLKAEIELIKRRFLMMRYS